MKKILVFLYAAFCCFALQAAPSKVDTLYLSDIYTTHMRYNTEITYVDISSTENVVAKVVEQNKNILAIRARSPFPGFSSLTVIESNETIHTYIVCYMASPAKLVIDSYDDAPKKPVFEVGGTGYNTMAAVEKAVSVGDLSPIPGAVPAGGPVFTLSDALKLPKELYHLQDKAYDIECHCENIVINKDMIYFVIRLVNHSGMTYNCPDASFVIEPKKTNKRSLNNEKSLFHRTSSGSLSCAPNKESKVVYCFDNFTILKEQCLRIYINEMGGQRELCIPVEYKDINKARLIY